ncbi:MAG: hypothetical protein CM1200mP2_20850 [Planctomycetaceae bacterium]|nr:MAG: hypothetical protein CM1200mP2_20850 [Planctomycetaceae bacterium]
MQFPFVVMAGVLVGAIIPIWCSSCSLFVRGFAAGCTESTFRWSDNLDADPPKRCQQVMDCLIMALQSGVSISVDKMEQGDAQQVDLKR